MLYIVGSILFVLAAYEYFFAGNRYLNWWFGQFSKNYLKYDIKKFRIVRGVSISVCAVSVILIELLDFKYYGFFLLVVAIIVALQYFVIFKYCKK